MDKPYLWQSVRSKVQVPCNQLWSAEPQRAAMRMRWSWDLGVIGPSGSYNLVCDMDNRETMLNDEMRAERGHARRQEGSRVWGRDTI